MDSFGAIAEFALGELSEEGVAALVPLASLEIIAPAPQVSAGVLIQQPAPLDIAVAAPAPELLTGVDIRMAAPIAIEVIGPTPEIGTVGALIDMGIEQTREAEPALAEAEITGRGEANTFTRPAGLNLIVPPPSVVTGVAISQPYPLVVELTAFTPEVGARRQPSRVQALAS
ncbi:hypothetical protein AUC70_11660 [Methyloceanibacter stevinii]|uniref:Uncharacterized protein n=1 Tax=Methyloceanibacter stevinii TaxID=1774970 RepID=A0A1E3VJ21_9HYPH|nr:hypothetical protein [Methyloceanibacter stevinii]ODR93515.1 hypothetical protein AUC70_11660 [Methyloceanibacter stevinii]